MDRRSVVVTGASTGIGRACAVRLARRGMTVYAGVRKDSDGRALKDQVASITPVTIDVTDRSSLEGAAEIVGGRLDGLVNNAGIAVPGPLEFLPLDRLREQFEVNVFGLVSSVQVFIGPARRARPHHQHGFDRRTRAGTPVTRSLRRVENGVSKR